jgi:polar amino acid transport system substrate-binding protein
MRTTRGVIALALVAALAAACSGGGAASPSAAASAAAPSVAPATDAPSAAASEAPSVEPSPSADACATDTLAVKTPGTLTIGADNPAYPPYFATREGGNTPPWEDSDFTGDPTTGEGFESAVGYAIAEELGFAAEAVTWIPVPFVNSYAPGPKDFDIYLSQVSAKPERAEAADLSDGYYDVLQSVVGLKDTPIASATTITALKDFTFGAQVGTTSYDTIVEVIQPTNDPQVFDTNDLAVKALKNGQIDGIVVDLPTADFVTNVQVPKAVAVGKFDTGTDEHFSAVLEKGSALTPCVDAAIAALQEAGTLDALVDEHLPFQDQVPVFAP